MRIYETVLGIMIACKIMGFAEIPSPLLLAGVLGYLLCSVVMRAIRNAELRARLDKAKPTDRVSTLAEIMAVVYERIR